MWSYQPHPLGTQVIHAGKYCFQASNIVFTLNTEQQTVGSCVSKWVQGCLSLTTSSITFPKQSRNILETLKGKLAAITMMCAYIYVYIYIFMCKLIKTLPYYYYKTSYILCCLVPYVLLGSHHCRMLMKIDWCGLSG